MRALALTALLALITSPRVCSFGPAESSEADAYSRATDARQFRCCLFLPATRIWFLTALRCRKKHIRTFAKIQSRKQLLNVEMMKSSRFGLKIMLVVLVQGNTGMRS